MIYIKTFPPGIKSLSSSFIEIVDILYISYHLRAVNESKSEVWKGKNPCHRGVNQHVYYVTNLDISLNMWIVHSRFILIDDLTTADLTRFIFTGSEIEQLNLLKSSF